MSDFHERLENPGCTGHLRKGREGPDLVRRTEEPQTAAGLVNAQTPRHVAVARQDWTEMVDVP